MRRRGGSCTPHDDIAYAISRQVQNPPIAVTPYGPGVRAARAPPRETVPRETVPRETVPRETVPPAAVGRGGVLVANPLLLN